jgi:hypothetical protein
MSSSNTGLALCRGAVCAPRTVSMNADVYWRQPYVALASTRALTEYVVLDVESLHQQQV